MMPFSRKQAVRRMVIGLMAIVPALKNDHIGVSLLPLNPMLRGTILNGFDCCQ